MFVIAEIGICHDGDIGKAMKLIDGAKWAGADCAKFQCFSSMKLWGDKRIEQYEISYDQLRLCAAYCKSIGIEFMCTPFDSEAVEFLVPLVKRMKIASGCITRMPILEAIPEDMPVILSTGMSVPNDINGALNALRVIDRPGDITLLHCTSAYPCRLEDVNLYAMGTLRDLYGIPVGYSDHTNGITVAIAAAALGATVIEKHLTLDRNAEGPDHAASITPKEFKAMRMAIGEVSAALGDGVKKVQKSEEALRRAWRG